MLLGQIIKLGQIRIEQILVIGDLRLKLRGILLHICDIAGCIVCRGIAFYLVELCRLGDNKRMLVSVFLL